jgi:hypothetical protein
MASPGDGDQQGHDRKAAGGVGGEYPQVPGGVAGVEVDDVADRVGRGSER